MNQRTVAQQIASALQAQINCQKNGNQEWHDRHGETIEQLVSDHLPSGSGFDAGTTLADDSKPNRLIFNTSFHHMTEHGMYDGWTEHQVIVTPCLVLGFSLRVTGRDRNDIKELIGDTFNDCLSQVEDG